MAYRIGTFFKSINYKGSMAKRKIKPALVPVVCCANLLQIDLCTKKWKNYPKIQTFAQIETLYDK